MADQLNRHRWSLVFSLVGVLCLAFVSFGVGRAATDRGDEPLDHKLREYTELLDAARTWSAEDVSDDKLVYASVRGMIGTLDPHTYFLEPTGYHQMREKESGSYYGVGLLVTQRNGRLTV